MVDHATAADMTIIHHDNRTTTILKSLPPPPHRIAMFLQWMFWMMCVSLPLEGEEISDVDGIFVEQLIVMECVSPGDGGGRQPVR